MVTVGKAIWKMVTTPHVMYGRAVIPTSETNIGKLQRIENKVWRHLLGIGGHATVEGLRGEIGASQVKSRVMKTMLAYMVDTMASDFTKIKSMMTDTIERGKGKWYNAINSYRVELGLTLEKVETIDRTDLKKIVRQYDN